MLKVLSLGVILSLTAISANAQMIVVGDGPAQLCYQKVDRGDQGKRSSINVCKKALAEEALAPKDYSATLVNLGILYMRAENHFAALSSFDKAISRSPNLSEAYINRGATLIFLNRPAEAIQSLDNSIKLGTERLPEALYNRAIAYEDTNQLLAAYKDLKRASMLRPEWEPATRALKRFSVKPKRNKYGV